MSPALIGRAAGRLDCGLGMSGRGYGAEPVRPGGLAGPGEERDRAPHADHCGRQRKMGPLTGSGGAAMRPIRWPHAIN
jgi:hypothetical protein